MNAESRHGNGNGGSDNNGKGHRRAVAIAYDGDGAPRVSAKGEGKLAERIESVARDNDVPLVTDGALSGFLARVPLGHETPRRNCTWRSRKYWYLPTA